MDIKLKQLNEPFVIETGEADGQLVQITIRAVEGGKLGYEEIREATRQILEYARREHRPSIESRLNPDLRRESVRQLRAAYESGQGRVTDEYLARLAVVYAELAPEGRSVSVRLGMAIGKPVQTVKGHIMRARREGFLTEAVEGREGGEATDKAREVLGMLPRT